VRSFESSSSSRQVVAQHCKGVTRSLAQQMAALIQLIQQNLSWQWAEMGTCASTACSGSYAGWGCGIMRGMSSSWHATQLRVLEVALWKGRDAGVCWIGWCTRFVAAWTDSCCSCAVLGIPRHYDSQHHSSAV
jgi:hypothetical protein